MSDWIDCVDPAHLYEEVRVTFDADGVTYTYRCKLCKDPVGSQATNFCTNERCLNEYIRPHLILRATMGEEAFIDAVRSGYIPGYPRA